jgi:hypothetical protein
VVYTAIVEVWKALKRRFGLGAPVLKPRVGGEA